MLDEKRSALLSLVVDGCKNGEYTVFSDDDFPFLEGEGAFSCLSFLSDLGFVSLKYAGHGLYCVKPTGKGKAYLSESAERKKKTAEEEKRTTRYFYFALLGGVIGGLLSALAVLTAVRFSGAIA